MTTQAARTQGPRWPTLRWRRWLADRRQIEVAAIDLHERYGAAAYGIARDSARRGG